MKRITSVLPEKSTRGHIQHTCVYRGQRVPTGVPNERRWLAAETTSSSEAGRGGSELTSTSYIVSTISSTSSEETAELSAGVLATTCTNVALPPGQLRAGCPGSPHTWHFLGAPQSLASCPVSPQSRHVRPGQTPSTWPADQQLLQNGGCREYTM